MLGPALSPSPEPSAGLPPETTLSLTMQGFPAPVARTNILAMTLSNRAIIALAITPNAVYVVCLTGIMVARSMVGLQPLPTGAMPFVMGVSGALPLASIAFANFLRLRRDS